MYAMITNREVFDKALCEALYASIASDTGCFKYGNTTSLTHDIAAKLMSVGIDAEDINRRLFDIKTRAQLAVESLALSNLQFFWQRPACRCRFGFCRAWLPSAQPTTTPTRSPSLHA